MGIGRGLACVSPDCGDAAFPGGYRGQCTSGILPGLAYFPDEVFPDSILRGFLAGICCPCDGCCFAVVLPVPECGGSTQPRGEELRLSA